MEQLPNMQQLLTQRYLDKSKVLVHVDLHGQHGIAGSGIQPGVLHLLVKEVDHEVLCDPEGDVADVEPASLPGHLAGGGLRRRGDREGCGRLPQGWWGGSYRWNLARSCG